MGYVYFITDLFNIKIGYTKNNPNKRLKQLNTGSPNQLYLLGYIKGIKKMKIDYIKLLMNSKLEIMESGFNLTKL